MGGEHRDVGWRHQQNLLPIMIVMALTQSAPPESGTTTTATRIDLEPGLGTVPNQVTVVRTCLAVVLGVLSAANQSTDLLVVGYATYWCGDVLDGWLARRRREETRAGALLDIVSDRACTALLAMALVVQAPTLWLPIAVFLVQFMVVDCCASVATLKWPILGPNYFGSVDPITWRWNWSPAAKVTNSATVVLALAIGLPYLALTVALMQLSLKTWTVRRMARLVVPSPSGQRSR